MSQTSSQDDLEAEINLLRIELFDLKQRVEHLEHKNGYKPKEECFKRFQETF